MQKNSGALKPVKARQPWVTPPRESNPQFPYEAVQLDSHAQPMSRTSLVAERRQKYIHQAHKITQHLRRGGLQQKIIKVFGQLINTNLLQYCQKEREGRGDWVHKRRTGGVGTQTAEAPHHHKQQGRGDGDIASKREGKKGRERKNRDCLEKASLISLLS
jgi:hypothetical protein